MSDRDRAADTSDRGVEDAHTGQKGDIGVGHAQAAPIVQMHTDVVETDLLADIGDDPVDVVG